MKKFGLVLLLGVIMASVAWGAEKPRPVHVMTLSGNSGLAMARLIDRADGGKGRFDYTVLKSPDLLMGKVIAGEADIAALPINQAAILYNKGVGIQVPAVIGYGMLYVVGEKSAVRRWTDLKGKAINLVAKGAVPDLLFRYLARQNGLHPDQDLKISYIASPVEAAQMAAAGKVSLTVLPEPWVTEVMVRNPKMKVVLDFQSEWRRLEKTKVTYPQTCIVVSRKLLTENPALVRTFLRELEQSIIWINHNPEAAGVLAEQHVQIMAVAVRKGLKRCNIRYQPVGKVKLEVQHFLQKLAAIESASIGGKLPDDGFYVQP